MTSRHRLPIRPLLALCILACFAPPAAAAPVRFPATEAGWPDQVRDEMDVTPYLAFHQVRGALNYRPERMTATPNQQAFDVFSYDLDLAPNITTHVLSASVRVRARVVGGPLTTLELDFADNMVVDSVRSAGLTAGFTRPAGLVTVTLDRPYAAGEALDVTLWYHGTPASGAFGPVFSTTTRSGLPLVWNLSEPFGARAWWPCKDVPEDKADSVTVRVTVPSGMKTASNGRLVQSSDDGLQAVTLWKERHAISTYLVSLASYPYSLAFDWYRPTPVDSMELRFYVFPDHAAGAAVVNAKVKDMIAAYAARFGEYPFLEEKYGEAEFGWGGGMEHQTCTSLGSFSEYIVAHELAHQWWGDMVTCRDFHHVWLNEGFATYGEAIWAEANGGMPAYRADLAYNRYYGAGTIWAPDENDVGRVFDGNLSYNKASWVLHMLRGVLGDSLFFASLARYRQLHQYGTATTEDFRAACEQVSGRDLAKYFQQWIYGEYYPQYRWRSSGQPVAGGWDVTVTLEQIQSWQLFWMPVGIRIHLPQGAQTFTAWDSLQTQSFTFRVPQAPDSVQIDPDEWILRTVTPVTADVAPAASAPRLELAPPRPNPSRGGASLAFVLPRAARVNLAIYDLAGARVRVLASEVLAAGPHTRVWDGRDEAGRSAPAGLYLVRLESPAGAVSRRLIVLR